MKTVVAIALIIAWAGQAKGRQILIGDPLYNPFKKNSALAIEDLPPGLAMPDEWPR